MGSSLENLFFKVGSQTNPRGDFLKKDLAEKGGCVFEGVHIQMHIIGN